MIQMSLYVSYCFICNCLHWCIFHDFVVGVASTVIEAVVRERAAAARTNPASRRRLMTSLFSLFFTSNARCTKHTKHLLSVWPSSSISSVAGFVLAAAAVSLAPLLLQSS